MRRTIGAAVLTAVLVGCGGGGDGEPTSVPTTPPSSTSTSTSVPPPPGSGAAVGTFRACHKRRDGAIVLILLFENRDRSLIGDFAGAVGFEVSPVDPLTWEATGEPVTVDPGYNAHVRQITVPPEQPAPPSEVTLEVVTTAAVDPTNVLATNDVTIPIPSSSCSRA